VKVVPKAGLVFQSRPTIADQPQVRNGKVEWCCLMTSTLAFGGPEIPSHSGHLRQAARSAAAAAIEWRGRAIFRLESIGGASSEQNNPARLPKPVLITLLLGMG